jgi:hypothetical protein
MVINKINPASKKFETFIRNNFSQILCYAAILLVVVLTFALQTRLVGWEQGYDDLQPKHHGWVSSQGLAIISSATLENKFVGNAIEYIDEQGNMVYDYFDRYPVFFSAIFNRVLALSPKPYIKIYLAKQVMNGIFLGTLILAFLIVDKLIKNKPVALTVALLAFSNPFLLFYKDMVHFDQPALFGFLLLIYAIALYKLDGLKFPVIISTFIAVGLGRGYASYAVLGLWVVLEAFMVLKSKDLGFGQKIKNIIKHPSFILSVLGIVWGAGLLSYNIFVEAQTRNIPFMETGIVNSAGQRLALNEEFNEQYDYVINWGDFIQSEVNRIIQWSFPINKVNLEFIGNAVLLVVMFFVMIKIVRRQSEEKRMIYLILMLSGFVWLIPLRNLAAFHDYTTMYFIGIPLVFFLSVFIFLNPSKEASHYLAITGVIVYLFAISSVKVWHESRAGDSSKYTYDFTRIVERIDGVGNNVHLTDEVPFGPYAPRFYLSEQHLAPLELADYVITKDEAYPLENLTPENSELFLYKK